MDLGAAPSGTAEGLHAANRATRGVTDMVGGPKANPKIRSLASISEGDVVSFVPAVHDLPTATFDTDFPSLCPLL